MTDQHDSEHTLTGGIVIRIRTEYEIDEGKPENMWFYQINADGSEHEIQPVPDDVNTIADQIIVSTNL